MNTPPRWITDLTDALTGHLVPFAMAAPIGVHLQPADSTEGLGDHTFEVTLFYGATEVLGGPKDGTSVVAPFWFDLRGVTDLFDRVDAFAWQAGSLGSEDDFGPHIALEGMFRGRPVRVRILASPPAHLPPARTADVIAGTFSDCW